MHRHVKEAHIETLTGKPYRRRALGGGIEPDGWQYWRTVTSSLWNVSHIGKRLRCVVKFELLDHVDQTEVLLWFKSW